MEQDILDGLNELLSAEYTSIVQMMQHSFILQGIEREAFADMLRGHAKESVDHAAELGDKIVALGGVPTVQVGTVRQSTDWREMLQQDLDQHHEVVTRVNELVERCEERRHVALRVLLEEMCYEETKFMEGLERALSLKKISLVREKGKTPRVKVG